MKILHALRYNPEDTFHVGEEEQSEDGLYVSEQEYWEKYYNHPDFNYEWNNGYLEEKPMTDYKGSEVYKWFLILLDQFLKKFPTAKMIGLEFGFRLALPMQRKTVRKPDLAVVLNSNPIILGNDDFSYKGTFDICVESLSYSKKKEIIRDTVEKKEEYAGVGVKEYYILDAREKETGFYRLNRKGKYSRIKPVRKDIIRSEVLPGFQFRITDLYNQPSLEKLTEDEIYQGYVLPFHQKVKRIAEQERRRAEYAELQLTSERLNAEQERQRAEQVSLQLIAEQQRAEQAEQRAALLADKLKQLGIAPEQREP